MKPRRALQRPPQPESDTSFGTERRADSRIRTVYRVARVATGCDLGLWRVRNISDRGMMLATSATVAVGDRISLALSDTVAIEGVIAWSEDGCCGIVFDSRIDSAALLAMLVAERRSADYRAPRLPVTARALAYDETGIHPVTVCDLSQNGIGFSHHARFRPGMTVKLCLENGVERRGVVRWSDDHQAGLALVDPFTCEDLASVSRFGG